MREFTGHNDIKPNNVIDFVRTRELSGYKNMKPSDVIDFVCSIDRCVRCPFQFLLSIGPGGFFIPVSHKISRAPDGLGP